MDPRIRLMVPPFQIPSVDAGLSTGAVERAGAGVVVLLEPDTVLAPLPTPPSSEVIREAIRPRRALTPLVSAMGMAAALAPGMLGPRRRAQPLARATPHGVAAALKAETPHAVSGPADAPPTWKHVLQRAERKAANRRKAKRGWR